jgi:hypothetical protein
MLLLLGQIKRGSGKRRERKKKYRGAVQKRGRRLSELEIIKREAELFSG